MGRSVSGLTSSSSEGSNIIIMNSKTILLFFGVLVCVTISSVMAENEEGLAENAAVERIVRMADPVKRERKNKRKERRNKGKKGGKKRKINKLKKKGRKSKPYKTQQNIRKNMGKKQTKDKQGKKQRNMSKVVGRQDTTTMIDSSCLSNAVLYMKQLKDVVGNFEKQNKRMQAQNKTGGKKADKKGAFASIALHLVDIGGGNKSSLSCAGSTTNSGAKQLANLTSELFDCEKNVNASCSTDNFPQPNMTLISNCETLTSAFKKNVTECLDKTVGGKATTASDACTCWSSKDLATASTDIKECKATDAAKAITAQLNTCKAAFGKCRKYEDAAGASLSACSQSTSGLTTKAATLKANSDAMTSAKTKMTSLSSSSSSGRRVRATATTCAEVLSKAATLSSTASSSPSDSSIATLAAEISGVSSSVSCTDDQKTSMTTQITALATAITDVDTAYAAVQSLLETLTGSTASSSSLTTASSSATAASSGRRERLVRDIMKNLL